MKLNEKTANDSLASTRVNRNVYRPLPKKGPHILLVCVTIVVFIAIGAMFAVGISR